MSAYQVNKLCYRLYHDRSFREAIKTDPAKAIADWPLTEKERAALLAGDVKWLYELGTHPFLLGHITRWDLFGVTSAIYSERIREAREPAG